MVDYEVTSKGHESDDEGSVSVSHSSKSGRSRSSESGDERSDKYDSGSSSSKQIVPKRSPAHDLVIGEFKNHFVSKRHESDSDKTISDPENSDDEDHQKGGTKAVKGAYKFNEERNSHERYPRKESPSSSNDSCAHKGKSYAHKGPGKTILPPREKIFLMEQQPKSNLVTVAGRTEPKMKPVPFDGPLTDSRHPPQIHIDFNDRPIQKNEVDDVSSESEEEKPQPQHTSVRFQEEKGDVNVHEHHQKVDEEDEDTTKKSFHALTSMFGGSIKQKRAEERTESTESSEESSVDEEPSKLKSRRVPPVAAKYVEAVNAVPVIKKHPSLFEELGIEEEEEEKQSEASEYEEKHEEVREEGHTETKHDEEPLLLTEEERYMSVRVVRNVREYVQKHGGSDHVLIKMLGHDKKAKLYGSTKKNHHEPTDQELPKKEAAVQVSIEEEQKVAVEDSDRRSTVTEEETIIPFAERRKAFEELERKHSDHHIIRKKTTETLKEESSEVNDSRRHSIVSSKSRSDSSVSSESKELEPEEREEKHEDHQEQQRERIKIMPVSQRRQLYEAAAAANASH